MNDVRPARPTRRGSAYVLVMTLTAIVVVIGLGSLAVSRIGLRNAAARETGAGAEVLSLSAVEHALTVIDDAIDAAAAAATDWRLDFVHGETSPAIALGPGTTEWRLDDATGDGDLADDPSDPIRLYGTGRVDDAVRISSVLLVPSGDGLDVLLSPLHTAGNLTNNLPLTAVGGPVSVAGTLDNDDTIGGDVEAGAVAASGTITGTLDTPVPPKDMPPSSLYDMYEARATEIAWTDFDGGGGRFDPGLLSPAANPYGAENADGVYHISVPAGSHLRIGEGRIKGTLVLSCEGINAKIKFSDRLLLEPYRPDYPALVVKGVPGAKVEFGWPSGHISEATLGVNLNPAHTPYGGESDTDLADVYMPTIKGVVHIVDPATDVDIGDSLDPRHLVLTGTLVSEASVLMNSDGSATLTVDPALFTNPPDGYAKSDRVAPQPGTWRRETLP